MRALFCLIRSCGERYKVGGSPAAGSYFIISAGSVSAIDVALVITVVLLIVGVIDLQDVQGAGVVSQG